MFLLCRHMQVYTLLHTIRQINRLTQKREKEKKIYENWEHFRCALQSIRATHENSIFEMVRWRHFNKHFHFGKFAQCLEHQTIRDVFKLRTHRNNARYESGWNSTQRNERIRSKNRQTNKKICWK